MIQVHKQLHDFYKLKRKLPSPYQLIALIDSLEKEDLQVSITLNQKGIILELLAKVCLNQFQLFAKVLLDFQASLHGRNLDIKYKSTVKKKRVNGDKGNSTTIKRKKNSQEPQIVRNAADLDEILQRQLSSPKNIQIRSQDTSNLSNLKERFSIHQNNIQPPIWQSQQFVTPIKQGIQLSGQYEKNLDIYRTLITIPNKKKEKNSTKNRSNIKTRKKQYTQSIPQQINSYISLQNTSQLTLKKQIQNILEVTKKKKNKEKIDLFYHEALKISNENNILHSLLSNKQNMLKFIKQNDKINVHLLSNEIYSQRSHRGNLLEQIYYSEDNVGQQFILQQKQQRQLNNLNQEIGKYKSIGFNAFVQNLNLGKEQKSEFFYNLLCQSDKYELNQSQVHNFGPIQICLVK